MVYYNDNELMIRYMEEADAGENILTLRESTTLPGRAKQRKQEGSLYCGISYEEYW